MDTVKVQSGNPKEGISKSCINDNLSNLNTASNTTVQHSEGDDNAEVKNTQQTVPFLDNAIASFANNNPILTKPLPKQGDPSADESGLTINTTIAATDSAKEFKSNASLNAGERILSDITKLTETMAGDGPPRAGEKQFEISPLTLQTYPKQIDEFNHKPVIDVDLNVHSDDSTKKGLVIKGSSQVSPLKHEQKESNSNFDSAKSPKSLRGADVSTAVTPVSIDSTVKGDQVNQPKSDSSPKLLPSVTNAQIEISGVQKKDTTHQEEVKSMIPCEPLISPKGTKVCEEGKESGESMKEICQNPLKRDETTKESTLSSISKTKMDEENDLYTSDEKEAVVEEVMIQKDVMKTGTNDRLIEEWKKSEEKTKEGKKDSKKDNLPSSLDDQILPKSSFGDDQTVYGRQTTKESVLDNILDDIVTSFDDFATAGDKSPKKPEAKKRQKEAKEMETGIENAKNSEQMKKEEKDAKEMERGIENAKNSEQMKKEVKKEEKDAKELEGGIENTKNSEQMKKEEIEHQKKHAKDANKNSDSEPCKQEPKDDKDSPKEMKQETKETKQNFQSIKSESKEDNRNKDLIKGPPSMKEESKQIEMEPKEIKHVSKSLNQESQKADTIENQTKPVESPLIKMKQECKETKPSSDSQTGELKRTNESPRQMENLRQVSQSPVQLKKADKHIKEVPKETKQNEMQGIDASPVKILSSKEKRQESKPLTNLNKATTDEKRNTSAKYGSNQKEIKSATTRLKQEKELKEKHKQIVNAVKRLLPEEAHDSGVDESTQSKDGAAKDAPKDGRKSPQKRQPRSVDPSPMKRTPQTTTSAERKLPMNKVEVGKSASPNIKNVRSKIGSLDNSAYKPGGGKVKIESKKLDFSKASSRIAAKNEKYSPGGGEKKIEVVKLKWNASSKVGSLDKKDHKPGGGDKKVESHKLNFREKAEAKVGSKDNIKHKAGGGDVEIPTEKLEFKTKATSKVGSLDNVKHKAQGGDKKIFDDKDYLRQVQSSSSASPCKTPTSRTSSGRASGAISPATTGTISPGPQEE